MGPIQAETQADIVGLAEDTQQIMHAYQEKDEDSENSEDRAVINAQEYAICTPSLSKAAGVIQIEEAMK